MKYINGDIDEEFIDQLFVEKRMGLDALSTPPTRSSELCFIASASIVGSQTFPDLTRNKTTVFEYPESSSTTCGYSRNRGNIRYQRGLTEKLIKPYYFERSGETRGVEGS